MVHEGQQPHLPSAVLRAGGAGCWGGAGAHLAGVSPLGTNTLGRPRVQLPDLIRQVHGGEQAAAPQHQARGYRRQLGKAQLGERKGKKSSEAQGRQQGGLCLQLQQLLQVPVLLLLLVPVPFLLPVPIPLPIQPSDPREEPGPMPVSLSPLSLAGGWDDTVALPSDSQEPPRGQGRVAEMRWELLQEHLAHLKENQPSHVENSQVAT